MPFFSPIRMASPASSKQVNRFCSFDERMSTLIRKCDFSYFIAIAAPDAGLPEFRTLCDWGNWVNEDAVIDCYFMLSLVLGVSIRRQCDKDIPFVTVH